MSIAHVPNPSIMQPIIKSDGVDIIPENEISSPSEFGFFISHVVENEQIAHKLPTPVDLESILVPEKQTGDAPKQNKIETTETNQRPDGLPTQDGPEFLNTLDAVGDINPKDIPPSPQTEKSQPTENRPLLETALKSQFGSIMLQPAQPKSDQPPREVKTVQLSQPAFPSAATPTDNTQVVGYRDARLSPEMGPPKLIDGDVVRSSIKKDAHLAPTQMIQPPKSMPPDQDVGKQGQNDSNGLLQNRNFMMVPDRAPTDPIPISGAASDQRIIAAPQPSLNAAMAPTVSLPFGGMLKEAASNEMFQAKTKEAMEDILPIQPRDLPARATLSPLVSPSSEQSAVRGIAQQLIASVVGEAQQREIQLNPKELGKLRMLIVANETTISMNITTERQETSDLMRRHIDTLTAEFKDMGYSSISFTFDDEQSAQDPEDNEAETNHVSTDPTQDAQAEPITQLATDAALDLRM